MHHNPAASYDFGTHTTMYSVLPHDTEWQAIASTLHVDAATAAFAAERTEYALDAYFEAQSNNA